MAERSDAFVVLPGGYGTFEEMFEMVTWLQLQLQSKPVGVVNCLGYYDALFEFLRHAADEGFIRPQHRQLVRTGASPAAVLDQLAEAVAASGASGGALDRA